MTTNTITDLKSIKAKFVCGEERKKDEKSRRKKIVMGAAEEKGERVMCACWWWSGDWARGWLSFLGGGKLPHLLLFFQKFFNSRQQEMKGGPTVGKKLSLSQTGSCRLISPTHHHPFYLFFFSFLLFYQTTHLHHRIVFCYYNFWRRFCRRQEFQLSTRLMSSHAANPATGPIPFFFVFCGFVR